MLFEIIAHAFLILGGLVILFTVFAELSFKQFFIQVLVGLFFVMCGITSYVVDDRYFNNHECECIDEKT